MAKKTQKSILFFVCFALVLIAVSYSAQEKKYDPIFGDYEFDMSDMGMGTMVVTIYFEDGSLWALPDTSSEPGQMEPVEGKEFEFVIEDEDGTFSLVFSKDETGKYTKCQVVNETMGMDVIGTRVKK